MVYSTVLNSCSFAFVLASPFSVLWTDAWAVYDLVQGLGQTAKTNVPGSVAVIGSFRSSVVDTWFGTRLKLQMPLTPANCLR